MTKPYFSIITCTYNSERYLKDCIKSVEKQSFKNYEHIFIDGYSQDKTIEIIKNYQRRNAGKVRFFQYPCKGISKAMNIGIEHSSGEIICHLHSDDYFYSAEVLKQVNKEIEHNPRANLFIGDCLFRQKGKFWPVFPTNPVERYLHHKLIRSYILLTNKIPHPSVFINKQVFERWGKFDESYKIVMDYEFWLRIFKQERIFFIDKFLSVYRVHAKTTSNVNKKIVSQEIKRLINSYKKDYFFERIIAVFLRFILKR